MARPTASEINDHLKRGGRVQVTTYARSTIYRPRHAGMFRETLKGSLAVQRGKNWDHLSIGETLLVSVRLIA